MRDFENIKINHWRKLKFYCQQLKYLLRLEFVILKKALVSSNKEKKLFGTLNIIMLAMSSWRPGWKNKKESDLCLDSPQLMIVTFNNHSNLECCWKSHFSNSFHTYDGHSIPGSCDHDWAIHDWCAFMTAAVSHGHVITICDLHSIAWSTSKVNREASSNLQVVIMW